MSNPEEAEPQRESSFYDSIASFMRGRIGAEVSNGRTFEIVTCGSVDMRNGIRRINGMLPKKSRRLDEYSDGTKGLFVDLVGILQNNVTEEFSLLICEVKMGRPTLTDLAQLLGYCAASTARHGLLISVGHSITGGLESILRNNRSLVDVRRTNGVRHSVGIATWVGSELRFDDIGFYRSIESLGREMDRAV